MKINLIDSLDDLTLGKYQEFMSLDVEDENYDSLVFSLFTGVSVSNVKNVSKKDIDSVMKHITKAIQVKGKFQNRFTVNGVELGLIPNLDKITGGEYTDLVSYSSKEKDGYNPQLNRLIAVLYRPVTKNDKFGNYNIEKYNGTSGYVHLINQLPMSIVNGVLGFFLTLSNNLEKNIQAYMEEEQLRGVLL